MRVRWVLLLLAVLALGLQVQPESITVEGGVGTEFEQVYTITNDQPRPVTAQITPHPYSQYLADDATLSKTRIALYPQESANVQLRGTVPNLGPETHRLTYRIAEDGRKTATFHVRIPVSGAPTLKPKLSLDVADAVQQEPVTASATLYNFGNVIAYYNLTLAVRDGQERLGTVQYPRAVQVLPGEEEMITLLYTDRLDPGEYVVELTGTVNDEQEVRATQPFRVLLEKQRRTIGVGEDLVLDLEHSGSAPRIEYVVTRGSEEVLRDQTQTSKDELTIPTSLLDPGRYDVAVHVTHSQGTDTTRLSLEVTERSLFSAWTLLGALLVAAIAALFTPAARLRLRILRLQYRVWRREKQLNALIRRAHEVSHES